jgi:O-antigen ligase
MFLSILSGDGMKLSAKCIAGDDIRGKIVPWLVIASLALFPAGRLAEIPLALLALIGLKVFFEKISTNSWEKSTLSFTLFFLCLWLPIIISAPDSYKISKTCSLAVEYLRFFLAGLAVLKYCVNAHNFKLINTCSLLIVSFWIFDALVQYFSGTDLFGFPAVPQRLNGVFGHKLKLGLFLSVYASFVIVLLYRKKHLFFSCIVNLLCVMVLLLAGSRGGWIMYGVVLTAFLAYKWHNNPKMFAASMGALLVCLLVAGTGLYYTSSSFTDRMNTTLQLFKGDEQSIDQAISLRLPIWKTATAMISAHPINGVGARAFRYAYPEYAKMDDIFLGPDFVEQHRTIGAMHSHQMQLEVLSETGLVGGFLFLAAMATLVWYWYAGSGIQKYSMLPYALGLAAFFFPLNTHYALYSSAWAQVVYWFVPLFFAAGAMEGPLPDAERQEAA